MLQYIASDKKRILIIGTQWVKKQSYDFVYHSRRLFQPELSSQGSENMVKLLLFSFEKCFGLFPMLPVEGSSETGILTDLSNLVIRSR